MKTIQELEKQLGMDIEKIIHRFDIRYPDSELATLSLTNFVITIRQLCIADTMQAMNNAFGSFKKETSNDTTQPTSPTTHP